MTLAFALRGSNGLVMGADSRRSGPDGSADTSTKFIRVNRQVGVLTFGLAEVGYVSINRLVDEVNNHGYFDTVSKERTVHFSKIGRQAKRIFEEEFSKWVEKLRLHAGAGQKIDPHDPAYTTGFILGGYDENETNQFKILQLTSPDFEVIEQPDTIAAQWKISQFLSHYFYYPEMSVGQLKRLAVFMMIETETVSETVGGQLKIATVTLESGFEFISESEIQKIINENQPRFARYRRELLDNLKNSG